MDGRPRGGKFSCSDAVRAIPSFITNQRCDYQRLSSWRKWAERYDFPWDHWCSNSTRRYKGTRQLWGVCLLRLQRMRCSGLWQTNMKWARICLKEVWRRFQQELRQWDSHCRFFFGGASVTQLALWGPLFSSQVHVHVKHLIFQLNPWDADENGRKTPAVAIDHPVRKGLVLTATTTTHANADLDTVDNSAFNDMNWETARLVRTAALRRRDIFISALAPISPAAVAKMTAIRRQVRCQRTLGGLFSGRHPKKPRKAASSKSVQGVSVMLKTLRLIRQLNWKDGFMRWNSMAELPPLEKRQRDVLKRQKGLNICWSHFRRARFDYGWCWDLHLVNAVLHPTSNVWHKARD